MSHFAHALEELLKKNRKTAAKLANATKISAAQISKLRNGEQTFINEEDLHKISKAISSDKWDHARLLEAHLLDECFGPAQHLVEIRIKREGDANALKDKGPDYLPRRLPPKFEHDLTVLRTHAIKNKALRDALHSFAEMCETSSKVEGAS